MGVSGVAPKQLLVISMEAFMGQWKLEYAACQGYDEFMAAEGTPADVLAQMKATDCVISFRKVEGHSDTYINNINFVGLFDFGDEEFTLGAEKTIDIPETGEKITNLMELTSEGELKTTTKKSSGVNIRVMKVEGNKIKSENNLTKNDETKVFHARSSQRWTRSSNKIKN